MSSFSTSISSTLAINSTITQDIDSIHQRRLVTIIEGITRDPKQITSWLVVILYAVPDYNHIAGLQTWEPMVSGLVLK
jgi:hypothetical protein